MISIASDAMAATGVTVLSDYQKGLLAGDVAGRLIAAAHGLGRMVIVDPKGSDYGRMPGPTKSSRTGATWARAPGCRSRTRPR